MKHYKPLFLCSIIWLIVLFQPLSLFAAENIGLSLSWQTGPIIVNLGDQGTLRLPKGYRFLYSADTQRLLKEMGNFPSGEELGLVAPDKGDEHWFVVIKYMDEGYIRDDDAQNWDPDAMLTAIREKTVEDNKKRGKLGMPQLEIIGWEEKPHYDKANNKVVWAISAKEADGVGVNYNTLALGRYGFMGMNMVGPLVNLPQLRLHTQTLLTNLNFIEGKRYADFNVSTDKVAAVGLSALIAGAAAKTGLLAKLGALILPVILAGKKFIIVIIAGIGVLLIKLWKRFRRSPTQSN